MANDVLTRPGRYQTVAENLEVKEVTVGDGERLGLKTRLGRCFGHLKASRIFGHASIVMLLIVHLLIGYRRLSDLRYYQDDPLVRRALGLKRLPARLMLDFDGSLIGTTRRAEGTAVGYNRKKKGKRSYYPLSGTVAQTGQVLDV